MPNKDKTGPEGKGPKTGKQMGDCKDAKPIAGKGLEFCRRGLRKFRCFRRQNKTDN